MTTVDCSKPLGLRFATETTIEEDKARRAKVPKVTWDPSIEKKIFEVVNTNGTSTTMKTGIDQWDHGDFY